MSDIIFPHIQKSIDDFLYDEEGNIPINKVLTIGSMLLILGLVMSDDAFAGHSSHRSHSSHSSHSSYSGGGHSSHASHQSSSDGYSGRDASTRGSTSSTQTHSSHNNVAPDIAMMNNIHIVGDNDNVDVIGASSVVKPAAALPDTTSMKIDVK